MNSKHAVTWPRALIFYALVIFLGACAPTRLEKPGLSLPPGTPESAATPQALGKPIQATTIATNATIPTYRPTPSIVPSLNSPPPPSGTWTAGTKNPFVIEDFRGIWSPTTDQLAGIQSSGRYTTGTLTIVQAPNFTISPLDTIHSDSAWQNLIWTPDGKNVIYSVVPDDPKNADIVDIKSDIWIVGNNGDIPTPIHITGKRALDFWGWMDHQTLTFTVYNGGGYQGIAEWNYKTGKFLAGDLLNVFALGSLTNTYAPVKSCDLVCTTYVILRNPKPVSGTCGPACLSKAFPRDGKTLTQHAEIFFQDWLLHGNNMLAAAKDQDEKGNERARLILWDVDTDQLTSVMAGAVYGRYSPDGKMLAWATYGPSSQFANNVSGPVMLDPINTHQQTYLQIMVLETRRTIFSLPVITYSLQEAVIDDFLDPLFTFSPDSQWMTLVTPGRLQSDDTKQPVQIMADHPNLWSFNIINLKTRQLVKSIEINGKFDFQHFRPVWSPKSDQFVYEDETGNWQLFVVDPASVVPIPQVNGKLVGDPSWSFDGRYLQLISETSYRDCQDIGCSRRTYIFDFSKD